MDYIFKNVTAVTMNDKTPVLKNTDVGVKDGKLTFDTQTLAAPRVIDCTYKVLMPGLYNCHTHAAMTLLRGYANDLTLEDWLFNHIFPAERHLTPGYVRTGVDLAIAEMIASGTVSFTDMYFYAVTRTTLRWRTGCSTTSSRRSDTLRPVTRIHMIFTRITYTGKQ